MRILLGISALVLVAILWATFHIVRLIRITQHRNSFRRQLKLTQETLQIQPMPSVSAIAPLPARFAAPIVPKALDKQNPLDEPNVLLKGTEPAPVIASTPAVPLPAQHRVLAEASSTQPPAEAPRTPSIRPFSLTAKDSAPQKPAPEDPPLRILEFLPNPATAQAQPPALALPPIATAPPKGNVRQMRPAVTSRPPQLPRPVRSAHPQAADSGTLPAHRSDWIYFNKDMGDLSDPLPGRIRDRLRSR